MAQPEPTPPGDAQPSSAGGRAARVIEQHQGTELSASTDLAAAVQATPQDENPGSAAEPSKAVEDQTSLRALYDRLDMDTDGMVTRVEIMKVLDKAAKDGDRAFLDLVVTTLGLPDHIRQDDGSQHLFEEVFKVGYPLAWSHPAIRTGLLTGAGCLRWTGHGQR